MAISKEMKAPVPWGRVLALKLVMSNSVGASTCLSVTGAPKTETAPRRRDERIETDFMFACWLVGDGTYSLSE